VRCGEICGSCGTLSTATRTAADRGAFQIKVGSEGYPPDLETLVNGVDVGGKEVRFLRRIPTDPMTNSTEWGLLHAGRSNIRLLGRAERF